MRHDVGWVASLSDGTTHFEGKGGFKEVAGQKSPWRRLVDHAKDKGLLITSLGLYDKNGGRYNLPPIGEKKSFAPYREHGTAPAAFNFFRRVDMSFGAGSEDPKVFAFVEASYPGVGVVRLYVRSGGFSSAAVWVDFESGAIDG